VSEANELPGASLLFAYPKCLPIFRRRYFKNTSGTLNVARSFSTGFPT
jgi:hypothetical protein